MSSLEERILDSIKAMPGQKAEGIAKQLEVDRKLVNSVLYGRLKGKVQQDKSYRWYPNTNATNLVKSEGMESKRLNTLLARLCGYYLDCLSHDDLGGVSVFAESKYGDPDYIELSKLPMFSDSGADPFDSDLGREMLKRIRRDRNRQTIFLGYPVRLNRIRSRKGWEGLMVEPLLLFSFQDAENRHGTPTLTDDLPQFNFRALRALSNAGETNIMEEAIQLAEELGLDSTGDSQPALDELLARLREIRSDWDWQQELDPYNLTNNTPIVSLNQQGIYNRAILVTAERSPYTKGLESELGILQSVEEAKYHDTALGAWLSGQTIESPPADQQPLLEVLPLNSEQRQAVRQALTNSLTVITGPPGTGKSQVVTSILVNAAWQGKTVMFASKNNKAVNVVETRVNSLGPRQVLLRLGTNQYQSALAEYLVSLLTATATPDDHENYREHEAIHAQLRARSDALDAELRSLVELRNEIDRLEQAVETVRQNVGEEIFRRFRGIPHTELKVAATRMRFAINRADRDKLPLLTRLIWPLVRKDRFTRLQHESDAFTSMAKQIGLSIPQEKADSSTINQWTHYGQRLDARVSEAEAAYQYFAKLETLTKARPVEELSKLQLRLTDDLASNSEALWDAWLRLQPDRLTREQRKLIGDYSALLQMIVSANEQNRQLSRGVLARYYKLFPQITSILPCWAVTSLAARGRVPFEPKFFDLLVIDEASQCDIASALPLLFRARRTVVIGDPKQLRHISRLPKQQDQQLLSKHGLLDDYPGWAYSTRSLFDLASSLCRSEDIVALRDHHRSHADIIGFSNAAFYEGRLRIATRYDQLRRPSVDEPAVRWIDVRGKATRPGSGGAINEQEASALVDEIHRLIKQGYRGSIGVVSPFRAQANRIRDLVFQRQDLSNRLADCDFLSDVVHSFQGDERDVILFSPVITSDAPRGALWFLKEYPNLFNVAITRARAALIVVGDKAAALDSGVDYLARFATYVGGIGIKSGQNQNIEVTDLGPNYPSVSNSEQVSDWERIFYRALYQAGIRSMPQYRVEKYDLDFAVIVGDRRLNIEIDGERYHRNWDGDLCRRDQIRNQRLMELGWDVMRFWVYQVRDDLSGCMRRVESWHSG